MNVNSKPTHIHSAAIFQKGRLLANQEIIIEDELVREIRPSDKEPTTRLISPGFTDLQVNGGGSILFNNTPTAKGAMAILNTHQALGTKEILPTVITDTPDIIDRAAAALQELWGTPGIIGIHIEGPHINVTHKGTHNPKHISPFDDRTMAVVTRLRKNAIPVMLTLAPELMKSRDLTALLEMGVVVSAGHSAASFSQMQEALDTGIQCFTHLYNAMPQMKSREPGMIAAALLSHAYCGFIVDGIHVDYAMLRLALNARPAPDLMFVVSDAMPTIGGSDTFELYGQPIRVENNRLINAEDALAGAHIDMVTSFQNLVRHLNVPLEDALRMVSTTPRKVMGLLGDIDIIGMPASTLLAFDQELNHSFLDQVTIKADTSSQSG